jgi:quercetin dioxygenase-like cupin family protein
MRPIRPFDLGAIQPGEASDWLIGPSDDVGVTLRIRRGQTGGAPVLSASDNERFALVLEGSAKLTTPGELHEGSVGELLFIPAGAEAAIMGDATSTWVEIEAPLQSPRTLPESKAEAIPVDPTKFEGDGFAWQPLIDRSSGSETMRMNVLQVAPGSGSPDWHIHAFCQIYVIQEGEMTVDIGKHRYVAGRNSIVYLPAGLVHRNFNASGSVERHVSLLVPEPKEGEIFDYSVTIHEVEAEIMTAIPA